MFYNYIKINSELLAIMAPIFQEHPKFHQLKHSSLIMNALFIDKTFRHRLSNTRTNDQSTM